MPAADGQPDADAGPPQRRPHRRLRRRRLPRLPRRRSCWPRQRARATSTPALGASGSHAYWVTAVDAVGNESLATPTTVVFADRDAPPAARPRCTPTRPRPQPVLTWTASTDVDTGNSGVDHYDVYRNDPLIARPLGTTLRRRAPHREPAPHVRVRAVDGAGNVSAARCPVVVDADVRGPDLRACRSRAGAWSASP